MTFLFGITYILSVTFPMIWTDVYGESVGVSGLNFISLGIGAFLGAFATARFSNGIYLRLKKRNDDVDLPELHCLILALGSVLTPVGLFWHGWSVEARVHWIMLNIGTAILPAGMLVCLQGLRAYTIDNYQSYAASGLAAAVVLRSLAGFGFPLIAPELLQRLGYGWGSSLLAFISIATGIPAPLLFWFFGSKWTAASKYAAG